MFYQPLTLTRNFFQDIREIADEMGFEVYSEYDEETKGYICRLVDVSGTQRHEMATGSGVSVIHAAHALVASAKRNANVDLEMGVIL